MDANKLVAHRGDNTNYPENSYAAIESALLAGAKFVEFDVQMNADGTLIVFHDADFKRTANNDSSVFTTTDQKMKSISAHGSQQFAEQHYPTHIPTLEEILKLLKRHPKTQALVEIKKESLKYFGLENTMQELLSALKEYSDQTTVISFSKKALIYTKQHSQNRTGFVFKILNEDNKTFAQKLKPDYLICPYKILVDNKTWDGDWKWVVYSLNQVSLAKEVLNRGDIDLIETDDIRLLLKS